MHKQSTINGYASLNRRPTRGQPGCPGRRWRHIVLVCFLAATPALADGVKLPYILDLSQLFHTRSDWLLVISQGPTDEIKGETGAVVDQKVGAIQLCFERKSGQICPSMGIVNRPGLFANDTTYVEVVHPGASPLLLVTTAGAVSPFGFSSGVTTWLWTYRDATDRFDLIFSNATGATNNQETRFLDHGPLAGDIVVALNPPPGSPPPYPYTITVYRRAGMGAYRQILHYVARSREGDGNSLGVIDAEMPVIEKRLHVWRAGQAPPTPKYLPANCKSPEIRHGLEWCH